MPMITLKMSAPRAEARVGEAVQLVLSLTSRLLGKDPEVTAVAVETVPPDRWFVAGKSLAEQSRSAFFLEVRVSDGTNTKKEKETYVAEAFGALAGLLGNVHPESYVHVIDARGDAYGYGGRTQERRFIEGRRLG